MRFCFRWKLFFGFFTFSLAVSASVLAFLLYEVDRLTGELVPGLVESAAAALLISLLGSLFASFLISSRLNRPIRLLEQGIQNVADGNIETPIPPIRTFDEFEPLIEHFNGMLDGLRERNRLERSLGILSSRFRALAERAPVAILQTDEAGSVIFVNDRWCELTGVAPDAAMGDGWTKAIHPEDRERIQTAWGAATGNGGEFGGEFRFLHPDGQVRTIRGAAWEWQDPASETSGRFGVFFDLTLRRQLEEERDRIFTMSLDLICVAGKDGFFREVNPAFERLLGRSREEILARPFYDLLHPEDVASTGQAVDRLSRGNPVALFENRAISHDGAIRHIEWTAAPVSNEHLFHAIGRDVTDRKRADEAERALLATRVQIELAREIQASLLPASPPHAAGLDIAAATHPADAVGGDYYDFLEMGEQRLGIVVGDAAGHGLGPALLMAQARAALRSLIGGTIGIEEILGRANDVIHDGCPENRFVTLLFLEIDILCRRLRYASCGHPEGWVLDRSGGIKARLFSTSLPLGCFRSSNIRLGAEVELVDGDLVLLVTDGIPEAESPEEEPFGEERLLAVVRANLEKPAARIVELVDQAVHAHSGRIPGDDDITSVVLKVLPLASA